MSTFFPQVDKLTSIPQIHFQYAEHTLKLLIAEILQYDEIDVGVFSKKRQNGAIISFTDSEFENVIVHLRYSSGEFKLIVEDRSEDINTSKFVYLLNDRLLEIIPTGLRAFMEEVDIENESAILRPKSLRE